MDDESSSLKPKFDLKKGEGVQLRLLGCIASLRRGKETKAAEAAIEPLHRYVYGRSGHSGERIPILDSVHGLA